MSGPRERRHQSSVLSPRRWVAALIALGVALLPGAAFAQEAAGGSDRDGVMLWTTVACVLALVVCAVGYMYRRTRGMDHPTPDELEMMGGHGHDDHDDGHAPADDRHADAGHGQAVHPHAEAEHGAASRAH